LHNAGSREFSLFTRGTKLNDLEEEQIDSTKLAESLQDLLSLERVCLAQKRARGIYEIEKNRIHVTTLYGKWKFGYMENGINYLKPYEALHLIEMVSSLVA